MQWTEQSMESAMRDVLQSGVAVRTAARQHNIPRNTLKRRVLNRNKQVLMQIINFYSVICICFADNEDICVEIASVAFAFCKRF